MPKKTDTMDQSSEEGPQAPEDARGAGYDNIASGWVRGATGKPSMFNETAENKPGFDHSPPARKCPDRSHEHGKR
jgi:hypothetical protein